MLTVATATTATLIGMSSVERLWHSISRAFRGRAVLSAILDLPLLIPHPVAGIALLLVFGRQSAVGVHVNRARARRRGVTSRNRLRDAVRVGAALHQRCLRSYQRVDPRYGGGTHTRRRCLAFVPPGDRHPRRGMVAASVVMWARAERVHGDRHPAYNPKVVSVLSVDHRDDVRTRRSATCRWSDGGARAHSAHGPARVAV